MWHCELAAAEVGGVNQLITISKTGRSPGVVLCVQVYFYILCRVKNMHG